VQGVGFRPAVYRLAVGLELAGWVRNDPHGVTIEIEGSRDTLDRFARELPGALIPPANLEATETTEIPATGETEFRVTESEAAGTAIGSLPADTAVCEACRRDMEGLGDRRRHYPFTTCSQCGPRFSLVHHLPYDRARTSMACFPLCPHCEKEYRDPMDRRFHAEPLCCPACGPRLRLLDAEGRETEVDEAAACERPDVPILAAVRRALEGGAIVAVKGIGGFQLACRADRIQPVRHLRARKRRPSKPFAVMVRDIGVAHELVHLTPADEVLLLSGKAPILLAPKKADVQDAIAPALDDLGVMLPTTPLHVELFREASYDRLVMTSGNVSDEPICCGNREAVGRLTDIADLILCHDRDVVRRLDDSVARSAPPGDSAAPFVVRRSRGWVPLTLPLPEKAAGPILALGGHLQTTACLALENQAIPSQHVGDLDNDGARRFLREAAEGLEELYQTRAEYFAIDAHPDYPSTWIGEAWATERGVPLVRFQHHLAHAAATLAEHGVFPQPDEEAAAIILDGTGYGPDGTAWGGEWLWLNGRLEWRRLTHLEPFPLLGGEKAVREPWRVLVALLVGTPEEELLPRLPVAELVAPRDLEIVASLAERSDWPKASGAGRLFEAAGALLGLAATNQYEGEAAARLESLAARSAPVEPWPESAVVHTGAVPQLSTALLLRAAAQRLAHGEAPAAVARGIHETFCRDVEVVTESVVPDGVRHIAFGGGCLVNRLLRQRLAERIAAAGYTPLLPQEVPPGDGGISYGQAVLASVGLARETALSQIV
jgi:hydrogenase maturation protein HypF